MARRDEAPTFRQFYEQRVASILGTEGAERRSGLRVVPAEDRPGLLVAMGGIDQNFMPRGQRRVLTLSLDEDEQLAMLGVVRRPVQSTEMWRPAEWGIRRYAVLGEGSLSRIGLAPNEWIDDPRTLSHQMQKRLADQLDALHNAGPHDDLLTNALCRELFLAPLLEGGHRPFRYDPIADLAIRFSD